jgi:fatty-acyl-CoA synthase
MPGNGTNPVHGHSARPYDWVGAWSEKRAELSPDRVGLVDDTTGREFTYADPDARANRTARLLCDHGVADGERVAVVSRNRPALVDLFFACG